MVKFDKGASLKLRAYGRTLFELIYHKTPIYAVDRQPLFCTFCARAQNVSKQSCHLGPSGPNGKIREKIPKSDRETRFYLPNNAEDESVELSI